MSLHTSLLRMVLLTLQFYGSSYNTPLWFKSQTFSGLSLRCSTNRLGFFFQGHTPCSSGKCSIVLRFLPIVGHRTSGGALVTACCFSCRSRCSPYIRECEGTVHLVFRTFFKGYYSICSCRFVMFMGGGKLRIFLH